MTPTDYVFQRFYWGAQIALAIIAFFAAWAALNQVRTYKLFELFKFVSEERFRAARRTVITEIEKRKKDEEWWNNSVDGDRWEDAASRVCGAYDLLGRLIEYDVLDHYLPFRSYGQFFLLNWGASIVRTHNALESFLKHRRETVPSAYEGFTELKRKASSLGSSS